MIWKPHVTVAAIIERNARFLMVEEHIDGKTVFNQPAGHLEEGESMLSAVIRETREETAWAFLPGGVVGIYQWRRNDSEATYIRVAFWGDCEDFNEDQPLDDEIIRTVWMTMDEINEQYRKMRSPLVRRGIEDFQRGQNHPLSLIADLSES